MGGCADERHDGFERPGRTGAPVLRDVTEQGCLILFHLLVTAREMRHVNRELPVVSESLQARLPGARAVRIAAAGIDVMYGAAGYACPPIIAHHCRIDATAKAGGS